jgi:hypothetical protein
MKNVLQIVTFKLKEENMLDTWKEMSAGITAAMKQNAKGFIYRESGIDEKGNVYCILKWETVELMMASREAFERGDFEEEKKKFEALVDMSTMKQELLEMF